MENPMTLQQTELSMIIGLRTAISRWGLALALLAVATMFFTSCVGTFPHFKRSRNVAVAFENGDVLPDHRYYIGGPKSKPNAVVAIHKDYTLESGDWREIEVDRKSLAQLIDQVGFVSGAKEKSWRFPNGAYIVGTDGKRVGVWYSVYDYSIVRMVSPSKISLSYPPSTLPAGISSEGLRS
jgi:hypothetical protein